MGSSDENLAAINYFAGIGAVGLAALALGSGLMSQS